MMIKRKNLQLLAPETRLLIHLKAIYAAKMQHPRSLEMYLGYQE